MDSCESDKNMTDKERKLTKVIMEYDNGDREYIDGEDVEKWQKAINSAIVLDYTHGGNAQKLLKEINWKKLK